MESQGVKFAGGHTETVLTVAITSPPNPRLISGAESGQLTVWTLEGAILHKSCIGEADITSVVCSLLNPDIFYAACADKILCFDLRQMEEPVHVYKCNDEEINQIALSEKEDYLAAADDSGNVTVFNLANKKVYKTLRKHSNICATVGFRPHRPNELVSGALDGNLIQWDFPKSRGFCVINTQDLAAVPEDVESYLVSPSFVHSVAISSTGNMLACGTENALVHVFDSSKRTVHLKKTLRHHTQGVSQVHFPRFSNDKYVVSGGNDGRIAIWDLEQELSHGVAITNGCSGAGHEAAANPSHNPAFGINHGEKINWLSSGIANNNRFLAVADNTNCPVLYPFPL